VARPRRIPQEFLPVHLRKVGCAIAPLRDLEASNFTFTDPEIELLAAAEHERWNPERIADGWTLADEKNVEQKQTPYLLPWKQLKKRHPDIAELDAVFIRAMPAILAPAGWEIIRTHEGTVIDSE
jgi:RyR domain